jgi:predicted transcriptional regulator of viral defense system
METYTTTEIIRTFKQKQIALFSLNDFSRLFNIKNRQTLYKKIQRLQEKKIIQLLIKGKYLFLLEHIFDFTLANYLYQPSYISLESALSFYGIISGFSYKLISLTTKKSRLFQINNKELQYCHIDPNYYWGYEKKDDFLIADKEKALLDYIYFGLKGLRSLDWGELELGQLSERKLITYAKEFNSKRLLSIIKRSI